MSYPEFGLQNVVDDAQGVKKGIITRESLMVNDPKIIINNRIQKFNDPIIMEENLRKMYTGDIKLNQYELEFPKSLLNKILKENTDPNYLAKVYTIRCINIAKDPYNLFVDFDDYYDLVGIDMFTNLFINRIKPEPQNGGSYTDQFISDFNETMNDINDGVYSGTQLFEDRNYPQNVNELTIKQITLLYNYAHKLLFSNVYDDNRAMNFFAQKILSNITDNIVTQETNALEIENMFNFKSKLKEALDKLYPEAVPKKKTLIERCFGPNCMGTFGGRTRRGRRGTKKTRKRQRRSKRA